MLAAAAPARAQCPEAPISYVFIDNHSVFDLANPSLDDRFDWAYRLANRLHVPTRTDVIRRELLFDIGDCYDPSVLRESERILRALPFLADADVFGVRQPDGSYHVVVNTRDEWSFRVEPQIDSRDAPELVGVALREDNLFGTGRQLSLFYLRRFDAPTYGFTFATPQLFRTRWDAGLSYSRGEVGQSLVQFVTYPFVGDVGRWAFRQQVRHTEQHFEYYSIDPERRLFTVLFPERRSAVDVGGVYRTGTRGRMTLLGLGVAGEQVGYPAVPVRVYTHRRPTSPGEVVIPDTFGAELERVSSVRALGLIGQRNIRFERRRALDTVQGTEDIRVGVEVEAAIGHTIPPFSEDRGLSLDFGLFAAGEPREGTYAGWQMNVEMRRDDHAPADRSEWSDLLGQMDVWAYLRPDPDSRHTFVGSLTVTGGWYTRVPFQLTLGGGAGLRGYRRHVDPGAHRVVVSLEHRSYLGWPYPRLFDAGLVTFLDAGRIWAGDVPFAHDSPLRASAGVGLRAAFPPGSRQTFRADASVPIAADVRFRDVIFQIGVGQAIGARAVRYDPQLRRSSRRGLTTSLFNFPN